VQIQQWPDKMKKTAAAQGFLTTFAAKRRRWFPYINSEHDKERAAAGRAAVNFTCQSGAADLAKWAMIRLEEAVVAQRLQEFMQMCLQIHDELVFLVNDGRLKQCVRLIRNTMQGVQTAPGMWKLQVPMKVKLRIGKTWGDLQEYEDSVG
jgi:DNA polymerase theta